MLNIAMAEISLKGPCVMTSVGQRVAARMAEHVRMGFECELGSSSASLDHAGEPSRGERRAPFRSEHEWRLRLLLTLEPPEGSQFASGRHQMVAGTFTRTSIIAL